MDELMRMGISLWLRAACSRKGHRGWILRIAFCMSRAHPSFFPCHKRAFHIPLIPLQSRRLYIASSRRLAEPGQSLVLADMYPLYWTISEGGFFMRYTYEFKKYCVDLYRKGQYPKTPEGFSQRGFRMMVRRWCRSVEIHGFKVLKHKKRNRVWTTEERFELVNRVLSGESFTSVAISAGICPGGLNTWIHKYKKMGYIGLIDRRKNRKPKESHMKKHKHIQPGRHKESEHEELIRLRSEIEFFKAQNEFFKTENAVIKKEIALREQKATARLKAKKQPSSRNSEPKDID